MYPVSMFQIFLRHTKGMKGLKIENQFPDTLSFLSSARHVIKENKRTQDLDDKEIYRLKRIMTMVRKQLQF